jgi:hypothetical protein
VPEPNTCLVCARPDLADIDAALDAGEGLNATARRFDLSRGAIQRYAKHRDAKPAKAPEAEAPPEPGPAPFEPAGSSRLEPGSKVARAGETPSLAPSPGMDVVAPATPASAARAPEPAPAAPPPAELSPPSEPPASTPPANVIAFPGGCAIGRDATR